jgi:hypothetical protein
VQGQLAAILEDYESAQRRLDDLVEGLTEVQWSGTLDPTRWSAAQCVEHLNLTSKAFIPTLREGVEKARAIGGKPPQRYRLDFPGWMIWRASGPTRGFGKLRTTAAFVPRGDLTRERVLAEFARLQKEQIEILKSADGLPLGNVKIASAFNPKFHYSVYSALSILPRHEHRHIQQAERAVTAMRRG